MRHCFSPIISLLICLCLVQSVWGAAPEDDEKVFAVQNRIFHRNHEIDLYGAYVTGDDFYNNYPLGIGYTYHLNDHISWEVLRAQYIFSVQKELKTDLENNFGVTPEYFPQPVYMYHSHIVFQPLYGKSALLNRWIINNETYLFAGIGLIHYEWKYSTGESSTEDALSFSFGAGVRYFLTNKFCLNFEIRDLVHLRKDATQNSLSFGVGLGYRFNFSPRKMEEDSIAKKLKKILEDGE